jgi:hypothetical protein
MGKGIPFHEEKDLTRQRLIPWNGLNDDVTEIWADEWQEAAALNSWSGTTA